MSAPHESSVGQIGFIQNNGLWTDEQDVIASELRRRLAHEDIRRVRIAWCDQHGIARGKTLTTPEFCWPCATVRISKRPH